MIVEGERLRLQAQQAVIERNKKIELERIEREKQKGWNNIEKQNLP